VIALRGDEPAGVEGCAQGWYGVEPEGYVCLDPTTTLDVDQHPVIAAKRAHSGDFTSPTPFHWSASREALLYRKVPSGDEQRETEYELPKHLARLEELRALAGREPKRRIPRALRGVDLEPARGQLPAFFADGKLSPYAEIAAPVGERARERARAKWIPSRSAIAWTDEFFAEGRSWVLTEDLLVAPKDKLVPFEPSAFEGAHIDGVNVRLPLAFVRKEPRPRFRLVPSASDLTPVSFEAEVMSDEPSPDDPDPLAGFREDTSPGELVETDPRWPRLAWVGLTGRFRKHDRVRYLETRDGSWMREHDATIVDAQPPRGFALGNGEKWIDVSIFKGTLVAYEGERAVFATLISPGANGYKREHGEPAKYTTPTGTFRIEWKHLSTTMTPDPKRLGYYLSEVPHTQFFHMPFALHAAYWHDRFGEPKSGGCVNLSPKDAQWLFGWTTPRLPKGWHGVRSGAQFGPGTWVRVR
jgi:hypothetical protein